MFVYHQIMTSNLLNFHKLFIKLDLSFTKSSSFLELTLVQAPESLILEPS